MLYILLLLFIANAKFEEGIFELNSITTEVKLMKFSFSRDTEGHVEANFAVAGEQPYFDRRQHNLQFTMFKDQTYARIVKLTEEGSLCDERLKIADWRRKIIPSTTDGRHFTVKTKIKPNELRSHYVYFIITDCSLEFYEAHPPPIRYTMTVLNGESHLPADESGMLQTHIVLFFTLMGFLVYGANNLFRAYRRGGQVHLIGLLTFTAFACQTSSVACEILHLIVYYNDGKGLRFRHSWFCADFYSELLQQASELVITFVLLSLAAGWTLHVPVMIDLESGAPMEETKLHGVKALSVRNFVSAFRHPGNIIKGQDWLANTLIVLLFFTQIVLEIYGRKFEEDFNSFHDHEHWPGFCLMMIRVLLGCIFYFGSRITLRKETLKDKNIITFLKNLQVYGTIYFVAFPLLVLLSYFFEPYHRHMVVTAGSITVQSTTLICMLRTFGDDASSYSKISSLGKKKEEVKSTGGHLRQRKAKVAMD